MTHAVRLSGDNGCCDIPPEDGIFTAAAGSGDDTFPAGGDSDFTTGGRGAPPIL
ncbi:MAG: hypothetical protein NT105_17540 [Verrucomicrobia bacterium]|nr:hypothetical protein [Verrucomicrobiota bacterium]